ncbi:recombinase family protein [Nocardiopsis eucommiae]|uniref:Recombinase family protein n=1 Tax=Nocardiopsis eucommiae TaxID=2831970 RepID=A0A975LC02_9ACTN|nr:recombinase family protein [Nocardiopsis eucommiae]
MSGRAWLYARVSKDLREGSSCDQQLTIGRRDCEREGVPIVGEYRDDDISASQYAKRARADWDRLMEDLRRDAQPGDRLWGWEISRLARERGTWSQTVRLLQDLGMFLWVGGRSTTRRTRRTCSSWTSCSPKLSRRWGTLASASSGTWPRGPRPAARLAGPGMGSSTSTTRRRARSWSGGPSLMRRRFSRRWPIGFSRGTA